MRSLLLLAANAALAENEAFNNDELSLRFLNESCGEPNLHQATICIESCEGGFLDCIVDCGYQDSQCLRHCTDIEEECLHGK